MFIETHIEFMSRPYYTISVMNMFNECRIFHKGVWQKLSMDFV